MVRAYRPLTEMASISCTGLSHRFSASEKRAAASPKFRRKSLPVPTGITVMAALGKPMTPLATSLAVPSPPQA